MSLNAYILKVVQIKNQLKMLIILKKYISQLFIVRDNRMAVISQSNRQTLQNSVDSSLILFYILEAKNYRMPHVSVTKRHREKVRNWIFWDVGKRLHVNMKCRSTEIAISRGVECFSAPGNWHLKCLVCFMCLGIQVQRPGFSITFVEDKKVLDRRL